MPGSGCYRLILGSWDVCDVHPHCVAGIRRLQPTGMASGTHGRYGSAGEPAQRDPRTRGAALMPGGSAGREGPPAEILDRFAAAPVARLARLSSDGPRIVPVTFAWHAGTAVWAVDDVKPKRGPELRRIRDLRADPRVALLVDHYQDDWSALWWVELRGTASTLEGRAAEAALDARTGDRHPAGALDLVVGELTRPRHREAFSAVRARERFSTERAETCP